MKTLLYSVKFDFYFLFVLMHFWPMEPVGIKITAWWCHWNEFPHLLFSVVVFFFYTMGCSFIISICLSLIFHNHISRSNDGGLKNFVIKTGIMRPFEAKSRSDHLWVRSKIPAQPCGNCNFGFVCFPFQTFSAAMPQTKSYHVQYYTVYANSSVVK